MCKSSATNFEHCCTRQAAGAGQDKPTATTGMHGSHMACMVCTWHVSFAQGVHGSHMACMVRTWHAWSAHGMHGPHRECMARTCRTVEDDGDCLGLEEGRREYMFVLHGLPGHSQAPTPLLEPVRPTKRPLVPAARFSGPGAQRTGDADGVPAGKARCGERDGSSGSGSAPWDSHACMRRDDRPTGGAVVPCKRQRSGTGTGERVGGATCIGGMRAPFSRTHATRGDPSIAGISGTSDALPPEAPRAPGADGTSSARMHGAVSRTAGLPTNGAAVRSHGMAQHSSPRVLSALRFDTQLLASAVNGLNQAPVATDTHACNETEGNKASLWGRAVDALFTVSGSTVRAATGSAVRAEHAGQAATAIDIAAPSARTVAAGLCTQSSSRGAEDVAPTKTLQRPGEQRECAAQAPCKATFTGGAAVRTSSDPSLPVAHATGSKHVEEPTPAAADDTHDGAASQADRGRYDSARPAASAALADPAVPADTTAASVGVFPAAGTAWAELRDTTPTAAHASSAARSTSAAEATPPAAPTEATPPAVATSPPLAAPPGTVVALPVVATPAALAGQPCVADPPDVFPDAVTVPPTPADAGPPAVASPPAVAAPPAAAAPHAAPAARGLPATSASPAVSAVATTPTHPAVGTAFMRRDANPAPTTLSPLTAVPCVLQASSPPGVARAACALAAVVAHSPPAALTATGIPTLTQLMGSHCPSHQADCRVPTAQTAAVPDAACHACDAHERALPMSNVPQPPHLPAPAACSRPQIANYVLMNTSGRLGEHCERLKRALSNRSGMVHASRPSLQPVTPLLVSPSAVRSAPEPATTLTHSAADHTRDDAVNVDDGGTKPSCSSADPAEVAGIPACVPLSRADAASALLAGRLCCVCCAREAVPAPPGLCQSCRYLRAALPGFGDRILGMLRDASKQLGDDASAAALWFRVRLLLFDSCESCCASADGRQATGCRVCNVHPPQNCSHLLEAAERTRTATFEGQIASELRGFAGPHQCYPHPSDMMCKLPPKKTTQIALMCNMCLLRCRQSCTSGRCRACNTLRQVCRTKYGSAVRHVREAIRVLGPDASVAALMQHVQLQLRPQASSASLPYFQACSVINATSALAGTAARKQTCRLRQSPHSMCSSLLRNVQTEAAETCTRNEPAETTPPLCCVCLLRFSLHATGKPWCAVCKVVYTSCSRDDRASARHVRTAVQMLGWHASADALVQHVLQQLRDHSPSSQAGLPDVQPDTVINEAQVQPQVMESKAPPAPQDQGSLAAGSQGAYVFSSTYPRQSEAARNSRQAPAPDTRIICADAGQSSRQTGAGVAGAGLAMPRSLAGKVAWHVRAAAKECELQHQLVSEYVQVRTCTHQGIW